MKKYLALVMLFAAPSIAMAQKAGERHAPLSPQERAAKHTARLDEVVSLTPDQRQKIAAENLRTAEAMQPHIEAIHAEKKTMREIGKKRHQAYASILTPEQMERLKAARKSERTDRKTHQGRLRTGRGAEMRTDAPSR